ncbi:DUF5677 domain-containing protein [Pseudomonas nitroreducens]|uniref:DUF5677 domain-containing protein n=1 Tax=Pseudomonas nitroreducens TaxID=46680 RepID=UPI00265AF98B|nr:DUF5677 domain-containing protein [Pseudomonas nitroreducens]MCP1649412.1 hypothetical protein [Pseudomonas nitroreducens]MCP1684627.1 hypothetical protein [Pseudomonas nitroreducens]
MDQGYDKHLINDALKKRQWAITANDIIRDCFDLSKDILSNDYKGAHPLVRFVYAQLYISCHLTSESCLILVQAGKEWDAEIIERALIEGSIKFLYLTTGDKDQIFEKANEFWKIMPEMSRLRRSDKIEETIKTSLETPSRGLTDLILSQSEKEKLREKYNKKSIALLNQKWSVTEIIREFSKSPRIELNCITALLHNYFISSNLAHMDADGVGMVWDRYQRSPENARAQTLAHAARLVFDCCTLAITRTTFLFRMLEVEKEKISEFKLIYQKFGQLTDDSSYALKEFEEIQYGAQDREPGKQE